MSLSLRKTLGLVGCGIWGQNILRDLKGLGHEVWVAEPSNEGRAAADLADGVVSCLEDLPRVDGLIVAEGLKLITFRERPYEDNARGLFYQKSAGANSSGET